MKMAMFSAKALQFFAFLSLGIQLAQNMYLS